jgi:hypothetical protein
MCMFVYAKGSTTPVDCCNLYKICIILYVVCYLGAVTKEDTRQCGSAFGLAPFLLSIHRTRWLMVDGWVHYFC